jgi:hypothetical protein
MDTGIIITIAALSIYLIVLIKGKHVTKKERNWIFLLILMTVGLSSFLMLNIPLNFIITFLNNTFGGLSRMVVNV